MRKHAAPKQSRDFMGINPIILSLAAMNGFHIEGMAQDKRDVLLGTQIGDPVPGEHAFGSNDDVFPERLYGVEKDFQVGSYVSVQHDLSRGIQDAQIHFLGMQVDSTVKIVLFGVYRARDEMKL